MSEPKCRREGCRRHTRSQSDGTPFLYCTIVCKNLDNELIRLEDAYGERDIPSEVWASLVTVCDEWSEYMAVRGRAFRSLKS